MVVGFGKKRGPNSSEKMHHRNMMHQVKIEDSESDMYKGKAKLKDQSVLNEFKIGDAVCGKALNCSNQCILISKSMDMFQTGTLDLVRSYQYLKRCPNSLTWVQASMRGFSTRGLKGLLKHFQSDHGHVKLQLGISLQSRVAMLTPCP
ncbi:hypothetical protein QJS10_CPA07g00922 [Acorus calamus]|uniref:Uncharacterized protein n=1 Tax=Acorus calamus TaxID=4465 RepID=A0AAV9EFW7_ACOCL|nr:hypothetical protein QJS10_CPA07g00922 [Acorus calamus]